MSDLRRRLAALEAIPCGTEFPKVDGFSWVGRGILVPLAPMRDAWERLARDSQEALAELERKAFDHDWR